MTREEIIRNLKYTMEKHKNDRVNTFDTNISVMCKDILDYLEQEPCEDAMQVTIAELEAFIWLYKRRYMKNERKESVRGMQDDVISRANALKCLEFKGDYNTLNEVHERLSKLPSVPSRKGHWIKHEGYNNDRWCTQYECSVCHEWSDDNTEYCPRCGAEMESEE